MITTCFKCSHKCDDTYRSTQCPHEEFAMHCGVFVGGKNGCAHTIEELDAAMHGVLPNPDCEQLLMILEIQAEIEEESCHFGDCD